MLQSPLKIGIQPFPKFDFFIAILYKKYSVFETYSFSVETINLALAKCTANMFFRIVMHARESFLENQPLICTKNPPISGFNLKILCSPNFIRSTIVDNIFTVLYRPKSVVFKLYELKQKKVYFRFL